MSKSRINYRAYLGKTKSGAEISVGRHPTNRGLLIVSIKSATSLGKQARMVRNLSGGRMETTFSIGKEAAEILRDAISASINTQF